MVQQSIPTHVPWVITVSTALNTQQSTNAHLVRTTTRPVKTMPELARCVPQVSTVKGTDASHQTISVMRDSFADVVLTQQDLVILVFWKQQMLGHLVKHATKRTIVFVLCKTLQEVCKVIERFLKISLFFTLEKSTLR